MKTSLERGILKKEVYHSRWPKKWLWYCKKRATAKTHLPWGNNLEIRTWPAFHGYSPDTLEKDKVVQIRRHVNLIIRDTYTWACLSMANSSDMQPQMLNFKIMILSISHPIYLFFILILPKISSKLMLWCLPWKVQILHIIIREMGKEKLFGKEMGGWFCLHACWEQ